jgi:polyphenol oxidase
MSLSVGDTEENVQANRRIFFSSIGVVPEHVMLARLTHDHAVSVFRESDRGKDPVEDGLPPHEACFKSDAVVSDVPGLHFFLTFADCVPLLFYDSRRGAVGAAHAGWRGAASGMAAEVVRSMQENFQTDPKDLLVAIGPSIGPCCYSVGNHVIEEFRSSGLFPATAHPDGRTHLDLWETNRMQLLACGVGGDRIENMKICTSCGTSDFYSHRGEGGRTGRFALCLGKRPENR